MTSFNKKIKITLLVFVTQNHKLFSDYPLFKQIIKKLRIIFQEFDLNKNC
jgi:hypothetical protein